MPKTVTPFTTKLVEFDTTVPFAEVVARLEVEVNKAGSQDIVAKLVKAESQDEWKSLVTERTAGTGFLYFMEIPHYKFLKMADGVERPGMVVYAFGNPFTGVAVLKHNPLAAYSIPPRLLILEKSDGTGTVVSYHLPSTVMGVPAGDNDPSLQAVLEILDKKIEKLAAKITAVETIV
ncbi:hypothetical protein GALMADRAFT_70227 [Galerina marginata CBS 339.88]|uniref:DUF302 domain-containing protein n=1 Tax=Galerina marginata (strain CBS 339.88) TaxID=685588 RepID=A0A067T735_GALM3|nr:hypothetical protein GALMADRAFT_70227 [Galerina marginata CBS 339.88]